ncbi:MAG: glycosyltransferase family 1 protein, partial [Chitinophagaceae bacterium]|nr:glycosyltransferase family 1 protein [Chitinophagaceae bacterium]
MPNIKKIAIVVQRYGLQVNGGAEVHARMIAEKLSQNYYVTVLTSCAIDYKTWAPVLEAGESFENGIRILRFAPGKSRYRKHKTFNKLRERNPVQKIYKKLGRPQWWLKIFSSSLITPQDGINWLEAQGPYLPELIKYLHDNKDRFTAFIFFTALYYPSAMGVLTVPDKSILIPTLHDEMPVYFAVYQKVMAAPRWIFFNTKAEQQFSDNIFPAAKCKKEIVAVGIDPVSEIKDENVLAHFGIKAPYIIYAGRVDEAKGCDVLLAYFIKFINETNADIRLVFVGKITMEKKHHPHVTFTGFIDEQKKQQLIMQA